MKHLRSVLCHRHLHLIVALLAVLLTLPGMWVGWSLDDHFHRHTLDQVDRFGLGVGSRLDLFSLADGNPEQTHRVMDFGILPWWTLPELRLSFYRPVAALSHLADHTLWSDSAALMHFHSLLWFAALVVAVTALFRQTMGATWVAGLAALLWAIDDARGFAAGWLANRNILMATLFGVLALIAHIRWRRDGWRWGAWLAPLWLILALLSAESAIAFLAYLTAHALFLERGRWGGRLFGQIPYAVTGAVWWVVYHRMGYGTIGSNIYVDPAHAPLQFIAALVERGPILLLGQWGLPPSSFYMFASGFSLWLWWTGAVLFMGLIMAALWPLLRQDRVARFWATGMLLAVVPVCAAFPHDRHLQIIGLGGMGLLAQLLGYFRKNSSPKPARLGARFLGPVLIAIHLVWAPLSLPLTAWSPITFGLLTQDAVNLPGKPDLTGKDLILVNPPIPLFFMYLPVLRASNGLSLPAHYRVLTGGNTSLRISRPDRHSLCIRPANGYFSERMDCLFRSPSCPLAQDAVVSLTGMSAEVTALTSDGRPAEVWFRFSRPLEDASWVWMEWSEDGIRKFVPPPVGAHLTLQPVTPRLSPPRPD